MDIFRGSRMSDCSTNYTLLSVEQEHNYNLLLTRILASQNKNGSWGSREKDKVTLTSQAIQLMYVLGYNHENHAFKNATRWLEDHVQKGTSHWPTRLEVGLKIGEFEKLADDKYIDDFFNDLDYDLEHPTAHQRLDFFWHVLPTLIALYPYEARYTERTGKQVPHKKIVERVLQYAQTFSNNYTVVKNQANHTGLVALYLATISQEEAYQEYHEKYIAMINWLVSNIIETEKGICWQHSKGITSYVLMDIMECCPKNMELARQLPKIIDYIAPDNNGIVKKDEITTFNTKLHGDSLYVSMLSLRAMATVLSKKYPDELNKVKDINKNRLFLKKFLFKMEHWFSTQRKKIPIILSALITVGGLVAYIIGKIDEGTLILPIGVSCILNIVFDWLNKD